MKLLMFFICVLLAGCVNYNHAKEIEEVDNSNIDSSPVAPCIPTTNTDGEKLFKSNCSACHRPTYEKLIGPGLRNYRDTLVPSKKCQVDYLTPQELDAIRFYVD